MNRAIKFKLKNGKIVTIRRIRGTDYEDVMKYLDKFSRGAGAKWTWQYAGQPKKNKEQSLLGLIESSKEKIIEFRTLLAVNDKDGSLQQKYDDLMNNINQYEKSKDLAYQQLVKFSDDNSKVCNFNDVAKDINSNNKLYIFRFMRKYLLIFL